MTYRIVYAIMGAAFIIGSAVLLGSICVSAALRGEGDAEAFVIALKNTPVFINMVTGGFFLAGILFMVLGIKEDSPEKK
ncbi:MAG: hypothetical protein Q4E84_00760 [Clostridia bacterium]|nr:hypothetical protein [Clostridia bacterium]